MSKDQLLFCPLGGSGEIGMNLNLYAYGKQDDEKWIVVDMGVTFADDSIPGIESSAKVTPISTTIHFSSSCFP